MMRVKLFRFGPARRGAVAPLFAICLLPMIFMIALAIDFSFFTEARSQIQLAADAAATHAIRAATGTYALETADGIGNTTAQNDAVSAGEAAGVNWFAAQLGSLPTAIVSLNQGANPSASNSNPYVLVTPTTSPAGFTASVTYAGYYPPFFNRLFGQSSTNKWNIAGTAGASSQYSYVEILMMLDTSQSMDIADSGTNIQLLEQNTVCIPTNEDSTPADGMNNYQATIPNTATPTANSIDLRTAAYYTATSATQTNGTCAAGTTGPNAPCAFACHQSNQYITLNGQTLPNDLYGLARRNNVRLRIDDVFSAAENVVSSMIDTEQAGNQFAIGIYPFNDDIAGDNDASGAKILGIASGDGTNGNYEATYDLNAALSNLRAIDYNVTPSERSFPPLTDNNQDMDHKNFPQSVADFIKGDATSGVPLKSVTVATEGLSISNPVKDIFIVTDGMEDNAATSVIGRGIGEMTSIQDETGQTALAVCQKFKNLHYNVYVLYIPYDPLPNPFYLASGENPLDSAVQKDYPSLYTGDVIQAMAEVLSEDFPAYKGTNPPPDEAALQACASTTTSGASDFYIATSDDQINTELSLMLKSALSGAIQITN